MSAPSSHHPPLRCVLLGAGRIGWSYDGGAYDGTRSVSHAACYDRHPDTQLVGVFEPDEDARSAFAAGYRGPGSPRISGDLEEILGLAPDCVSVCSPSQHHAGQIDRLLGSEARYLWIEKPVTLSLAEHESLLAKWRATGRKQRIAVNYLRRGLPQYDVLREAARDGAPVAVHATYSRGLDVNGVHMLDQIGAVLGRTDAPELDWIDAANSDNPSFGFTSDGTSVTVTGMDLPYHCIELSVILPDRRLSVIRGGLELRDEPVEANPDYPGFYHLGPPQPGPQAGLYREAMLDGTYRNLCSLLDDTVEPPSTLETSLFAARLLDRVAARR